MRPPFSVVQQGTFNASGGSKALRTIAEPVPPATVRQHAERRLVDSSGRRNYTAAIVHAGSASW